MVCDMPEPCKFPFLDTCLKRFLWTHKEVDLAPHPVVGLVLQVGGVSSGAWLQKPGSVPFFFRVSKQNPCFTAVEKDGGDNRLVQLKLACEADGVPSPDPA